MRLFSDAGHFAARIMHTLFIVHWQRKRDWLFDLSWQSGSWLVRKVLIVLDKQCQNVHVNISRRSRGVVRHTATKNDYIYEEEEEMRESRYQERNQRIEILEIGSLLLKFWSWSKEDDSAVSHFYIRIQILHSIIYYSESKSIFYILYAIANAITIVNAIAIAIANANAIANTLYKNWWLVACNVIGRVSREFRSNRQ